MKEYYIYILANRRNGTLYVGITNDLVRRVYEHKNNLLKGFSKKYSTYQLVYYESTSEIDAAIAREKQLKTWTRKWKIALIERNNPQWCDLYNELNA